MHELNLRRWIRGSIVIAVGSLLCACRVGGGSAPDNGDGDGDNGPINGRTDAGTRTNPPPPPPPPPPPRVDDSVAIEELAACRAGASDAEITAAVVITDEYSDSLHELIGCGGLSFALCGALIDGVIDAIISQSDDATPDGWEFAGEGVYRTGSGGTVMDATFYLAEDFSFGQAGDPVTYDVFLVDSYLVDARLEIDFRSGDAQIEYDAPGPLVELLGFGAEPPNPLPVELNDLTSIKSKLRQLDFEGRVVVDDMREHAVISYTLNVPRMSAAAFVDGSALMRYELENVDGTSADLGQTIVTSLFDVAYANHGTLEGTADFKVQGGPLEYDAHLVWADTAYPERTLFCP